MIKREICGELEKCARLLPVVTLLGPRQSGKTTLVKHVFRHYSYANLEDSQVFELARTDSRLFFKQFSPPVIIDEVQRMPNLLRDIQVHVDEDGTPGRFVLTGSHQPMLQAEVSQSLAGRTTLSTLLPLSIRELGGELSRDELMFSGFLPRIHAFRLPPRRVLSDYLRTYVERDARQLINIKDWQRFETFLRLLAGRVGQIANLEGFSGDVGVSAITLKNWLSVLEASFIIFRLPPYYRNFGKRFVKSPKIYFTDVGLAAHLLAISSARQIAQHPLVGGLFENMVVIEALKARLNAGLEPNLYYMRDSSGVEADLVLEDATGLRLWEIKSSMTADMSFARNLRLLRKAIPEVVSADVVYAGEEWPLPPDGKFINFTSMGDAALCGGEEDG
ncbi:MAG: ATP-binding protein [Kiritimatiellae bacterium]|nr:ATP-binding protein [Kiritimatiellia bacterium]